MKALIRYIVFFHTVLFALTMAHAEKTVTMGIYQNIPLCFTDSSNQPQGIYIDVLNHIANKEGWRIKYRIDTWNRCLQALDKHEIDLMCGIAVTLERKNRYFFNDENVMLDWGQIYLSVGSSIQSILDLNHKKIATISGGILRTALQDLARAFDVTCNFVLVESANEVFDLIEQNEVDAGTVLRLFGMRFSYQYHVKPSPIVFAPLHLRFATANPQKQNLLNAIDYHLKSLKDTDSSVYYQSINRWLIDSPIHWHLPGWILISTAALLFFLLMTSIILKRKINRRTLELHSQNIKLQQEIDRRIEADKALAFSEKRFSQYIECSPDGVFVSDNNGCFAEVNPSACALTGYSRDELIGMSIFVLVPNDKQDKAKNHFAKVRHKGKSSGVLPYLTKSGTQKFWIISAVKLSNNEFLGFAKDITEIKIAENKLIKSERLLRTIAHNYPHSYVSIIEKDMTVSFSSGQEFQRMKLEPEQFNGKHLSEIFGTQATYIIQQYEKTFLGEEVSFELFFNDQYQLYKTVPMIESDNSIPRILVVVENISQQKKIEQEKAQLERQLLQAQKMEAIGTLAGGIAHDFNNILAIILGNIELCLEESDPMDPIHLSMAEAQTASIRARELIRQILNFSRQTMPDKEPIAIIPIVKESTQLIRASVPSSIKINTNIVDSEDAIIGNPTQINQILLNLCSNAVYAMGEKGTLTIEASREVPDPVPSLINDLEKKPYIKISVIDNGSGIPQDIINKVFDPYFTTKKIGEGSGMGLSMVYSIIQSHNGAITFHSSSDHGTQFNIFLPIIYEKVNTKQDLPEPTLKGSGNILFVDDEEMLVKLGRRMLTQMGYSVTGFHDPVAALSDFESHASDYDLVITDMTMPDISGKNFSKKILAIRPDIPIFLCTGYSDAIDETMAKELGIKQFLLKPLSKRKLAEEVYAVLMR
ncbi:MAG: Ntr family two-component system sensory/regulatory protein [Candidatus Magnetoglobus multicellularis str. Araruama]|uniref:histidine kinase n=1 Tax=Candidatus Magnetoglobus multicellularis str. Araruama TaxID=890399 RepID=A0A1V1PC97_9BACT|nr:MAG: Ntr family two-component system sensory/regulatory protein [Candidatus Magnetoglobus multicellularis str. Araruama]